MLFVEILGSRNGLVEATDVRIQLESGRFDQHECGHLLTGEKHRSDLDNHIEIWYAFGG